MKIVNLTKKTVVAYDVTPYRLLLDKIRGLMLRKEKQNIILINGKKDHISIHTIGMFYPIYVLWLDEHLRVTAVEHMKPNKPAKTHIGLSVLEVSETCGFNTEVGDTLTAEAD